MTAKDNKSAKGIAGFEKATRQLEAIIDTLGEDETSLEQALKAFEEGIKLTRSAQAALAMAEQKVNLLLEKEGEPTLATFVDTEDQA